MKTKLLGRWGEDLALRYLKKEKYTPVSMGYRSRFGEIDIIVKDKNFIVFVEVKLRKNGKFAEAREFVDKRKQQRIKDTAQIWLSVNETDLQPRFDVIEIYAPDGAATENPEINHIENAF